MSDTPRKPTHGEIAMKYGSRGPVPADDPIFKQGWVIGTTSPYRQPPRKLQQPTSTYPSSTDPMQGAIDQIEAALKAKDAQYLDDLANDPIDIDLE